MKYDITFCRYNTYCIEADDPDTAFKKAEDLFIEYITRPTHSLDYDDFIIKEAKEVEKEEN